MVVEYLHGHVFQGASRSFAGADPKGFGTEHGFTVAEYLRWPHTNVYIGAQGEA